MLNYLKSEFVKMRQNKLLFLSGIVYLGIIFYLKSTINEENLFAKYRIFSFATIFVLTMQNILSIGELFEKRMIRYYLEYIPDRKKFLAYVYVEYIALYLLANLMFMSLNLIYLKEDFLKSMISYLMIFSLYISINHIFIIYFSKVGATIVSSIVGLWILPNLVNYLVKDDFFYKWQIFYYLSPDSYQVIETSSDLLIPCVYFVICVFVSVLYLGKKEC